MASQSLETRVAALEEEVNRLKDQLGNSASRSWRNIVGTFANDPLYEKAMEYGRKYRESLRPKERKSKKRAPRKQRNDRS